MKCLKCQYENPDNAKFCIECGAPMEYHCPQCQSVVAAYTKGMELILKNLISMERFKRSAQ